MVTIKSYASIADGLKSLIVLLKTIVIKIHFELTSYPSEIIYGIHFEFDNRELNETLTKRISDEHALSMQSVDIKVNNIIPKKPEWIFLTRTVELAGDVDSDFATVLTHARHFVELVGHYYDILYSKQIVDAYLRWKTSGAGLHSRQN